MVKGRFPSHVNVILKITITDMCPSSIGLSKKKSASISISLVFS